MFKHAKADYVIFDWHIDNIMLHLQVKNNGVECTSKSLKPGKGLSNTRFRTEELSGTFNYKCHAETFTILIECPALNGADHA